MTAESSPIQSNIIAKLVASGVEVGPVVASRRLVKINPDTEGKVEEVYSFAAASRLIAMPREGEESQLHTELSRYGLPVLPRAENRLEDLDLLLIPPGTWSLGSRLHIIKRDFLAYSELLLQVAQAQRLQYESGFGFTAPTENLRIVDHFAFTPNLHTVTGQQLYMIPPYNTDSQTTPEMFATAFAYELAASGEFNEEQIVHLHNAIFREVMGNG